MGIRINFILENSMKKVVLGLVVLGAVAFAGVAGTGGVESVRKADNSGGIQYYKVKCKDGGSMVVGQNSSGMWYSGGSGEMGRAYSQNTSIDAMATAICK
jgi:hypothetical protein